MTMIAARERGRYDEVWSSIDRYGDYAPGADYVDAFRDMSGARTGARLLDAGCGTGRGALALCEAGYQVTLCDVTATGIVPAARHLPFVATALWSDLSLIGQQMGGCDYVYCCDVLEHVPIEFTMLTLARLFTLAEHGVFLSISLVPDAFGIWVGESLHETVQPFTWWRDRLREVGRLIECRDLGQTGLYFARAR